jgi:predicted metal-binding membrane protein
VNSRRVFLSISAIVFAASAAMTIVGRASMSAVGEMQMPGGWAMSMMWMRMPGQTWLGAGTSFVGMWVVMMVAMMLPSLTPLLWRYREAMAKAGGAHVGWLTALVGVGYFVVWAVFGVIVFPLGVALAATVMREPAVARAVPIVVGAAVLWSVIPPAYRVEGAASAFCRDAAAAANAVGRATPHGDMECASGYTAVTRVLA